MTARGPIHVRSLSLSLSLSLSNQDIEESLKHAQSISRFIFRENLKNGKERGGAYAVYHKGKLVFDMWGGYADVEAMRPWRRDTMTMTFSASKGVVAMVIAMFVEKYVLLDFSFSSCLKGCALI